MGGCQVDSLDHFVLTVKDLETSINFYCKVLGMTVERFGVSKDRIALHFGSQKINLHQVGKEFKPHAKTPMAGSGDLCFVSNTSLQVWAEHLACHSVLIEEGPVQRTGAMGAINSIYVRDPDENLIEICNYSS